MATSDQGRPRRRRFADVESASGIVLLAATAVAVGWASSPWSGAYDDLWATELAGRDLRHWVGDGLMATFFLVVGIEIKHELVAGHLASRRAAALPVAAALGGMVVPAAVYLAFNAGEPGAPGWGIPMATDIAFAVGVLALLGDRVPPALRAVLLALAIVDDIGAVAVIAVAYTDDLAPGWLLAAAAGVVVTAVLWRARLPLGLTIAAGVATWWCAARSGVHPTIAGVAIGLAAPADRAAARLRDRLHPWTSTLVLPLFALAHAGVALSGSALADAATSPVTIGVVAGLVAGKPLGVGLAVAIAVRAGVARLPAGVEPRHVAGVAALAGIGFTVSIFVAGLAFDDAEHAVLAERAKVGVLVASVLAAVLGAAVLGAATGRRRGRAGPCPSSTGP